MGSESTACRMRSMVGRESIDERVTPRRRCNTYALPACTGAVYSNRPRSSHDGLICEQLRRERPHGGAGLRLHTTVRNRAVSSRPRMPDRPSLITSPRRPAACDWLAPRPWGPDPLCRPLRLSQDRMPVGGNGLTTAVPLRSATSEKGADRTCEHTQIRRSFPSIVESSFSYHPIKLTTTTATIQTTIDSSPVPTTKTALPHHQSQATITPHPIGQL